MIALVFAGHSPGTLLSEKWASFEHPPSAAPGSTHLASLGSNRYDFWRVAVDEAGKHPLRGIGGRGFYTAYLQRRHSSETPLRAHSLYLDVLAETGVPGLLLLLVGAGAPVLLLVRRRARPSGAAALGAAAYFFTHAAVDWIWTVRVVGVVAFLLVGIGCGSDEPSRCRGEARWRPQRPV